MPIPRNITKEHILLALSEIDKKHYDPIYESRTYVLKVSGNSYPPKYVIKIANRHPNGHELDSSDYISQEANRFLERLGFTIMNISPGVGKHLPVPKEPLGKQEKSDADLVISLSKRMEEILEQLEVRGYNRDVAKWINDLERKGHIPRNIAFRMHSIRLSRNRVVHKEDVLSPAERSALYADWTIVDEWWKGKTAR